MESYRDLHAWQFSVDLAITIYRVTTRIPSSELFGLSKQLRTAAVSVASNIAEGQGRMTAGEWLQFLGHARGSLYEIETQITIARKPEFISDDDVTLVQREIERVAKKLGGLIRFVRKKAKR